MTRSLLTQRRLLFAIVVLLLIGSQLPAGIATRIGHLPRGIVVLMTAPFTAPLKMLSDSLRGGRSLPLGVGAAEEAQAKFARALVVIHQLELEIATLREENALLTQSDAIAMEGSRPIMARVVRYSGDSINPVLTIDRGAMKGVRDGAPVVHGVNLVGMVASTYPTAADVELITARGTQFRVRIGPPQVEANPREVVEMVFLSEDGTHFIIPQLTLDQPIEVGDWAHLADSRWPRAAQGWVVGKVTQVRDDPQNPLMFKQVVIQPMQPLPALSRVTVIVPVE